MRLGTFISNRLEPILAEWEAFAATLLPAAGGMDSAALRDHAKAMLEAIAEDLLSEQSDQAQHLKSRGLAPAVAGAPPTAAQSHAEVRAADGFDIIQIAAEFRALRATVLRLWLAESAPAPDDLQDIVRFNEAIDQALTESIRSFSLAIERSRNLLLGMLGHDMRNPLGVIVNTAHHLTLLNAGNDVSLAAARLIKSGARIQALVGDLVDFSRTQMGVGINVMRKPVDLAEIFHEQVDLQRAANPGRNLTLEVTGDVVGVWDGHRIHQVLGNLVSNALKHGDATTPVEVKLVGHAANVSFSVVNRGAAIPETFIEKMFEPLSRGQQTHNHADQDGDSLGLGLYIAREIVRAHQGDISVRSDETSTEFAVDLPR